MAKPLYISPEKAGFGNEAVGNGPLHPDIEEGVLYHGRDYGSKDKVKHVFFGKTPGNGDTTGKIHNPNWDTFEPSCFCNNYDLIKTRQYQCRGHILPGPLRGDSPIDIRICSGWNNINFKSII
jgi:hypothetical protein